MPGDDVAGLIAAMGSRATRTPAVVDAYYTACIPFYREFLGHHWHTGLYAASGPIGPQDQRGMELHIARSAGIGAGCEVLDVGCGIGGTACHLAQATGARLHGLTPNAAQIELARAHAAAQRVGARVCFVQGSADALPFPDASFDVVVFFESACHFADRGRFFREVWRVLRPGGRLAGEDWLASERMAEAERAPHVEAICDSWAIPELGTLAGYADGMRAAGLQVLEAVDLRDEMALLRGFLVEPDDREQVRREMQACAEPVRRLIMQALLILGEAAAVGAFTLGRFLARRPA